MKTIKNISRRNFLLGGAALASVGAATTFKPGDNGRNHSDYFVALSSALDRQHIARPTLVIDKDQLLANIATLKGHIANRFSYRIVAKSLPAIGLLKTVMDEAQTNKLMLFHQPFVSEVAQQFPHADILLGKPMPVIAAETFYQHHATNDFNIETQLQWLIDSPNRLTQYIALATKLNQKMRLNIELDVGLHRGGVSNDGDLAIMLKQMEADPYVEFSGFMGYEPHVAKMPGSKVAARDKAVAIYQHAVTIAEATLGRTIKDLTLNTGGSPTYQYYDSGAFPANELSVGSALVKPTDFDIASLTDHVPAAYIATPVLKAMKQTEIPGVDFLGEMMAMWNPNREQAFFTYGGYWKALPCSPQGLSINPLYGRSTNQEMLNGSKTIALKPDDWIFLRPTQSEFVFLQFGAIAVYSNGKITDRWPIFSQV